MKIVKITVFSAQNNCLQIGFLLMRIFPGLPSNFAHFGLYFRSHEHVVGRGRTRIFKIALILSVYLVYKLKLFFQKKMHTHSINSLEFFISS